MTDKQDIFVQVYANNGFNATEAYKTAYPDCKVGHQQSSSKLLLNPVIREAVDKIKKELQVKWKDRVKQVIARLGREISGTKSISSVCLLVNAQKGYMDMQAKNEGQYAADNAQRTEEAKLTEVQVKEAKEYAKWRLLKGLEEQELGAEILQEATEGDRSDDNDTNGTG